MDRSTYHSIEQSVWALNQAINCSINQLLFGRTKEKIERNFCPKKNSVPSQRRRRISFPSIPASRHTMTFFRCPLAPQSPAIGRPWLWRWCSAKSVSGHSAPMWKFRQWSGLNGDHLQAVREHSSGPAPRSAEISSHGPPKLWPENHRAMI